MIGHVGKIGISTYTNEHANIHQFDETGEATLTSNVTLLSKIPSPIKIKCDESFYYYEPEDKNIPNIVLREFDNISSTYPIFETLYDQLRQSQFIDNSEISSQIEQLKEVNETTIRKLLEIQKQTMSPQIPYLKPERSQQIYAYATPALILVNVICIIVIFFISGKRILQRLTRSCRSCCCTKDQTVQYNENTKENQGSIHGKN